MNKPTILYGEEKPTYFIIAEGGDAPKRGHASRISARNEAARLSKRNPNVKFHIVKLKETLIFDPEGYVDSDRQKQIFARGALAVGNYVRVKSEHHTLAGKTGRLARFGDLAEDDTSVYVVLDGDKHETRFSPSSLERSDSDKAEPAAGEAPKDSEANPIGKLVAGLLGRALAEAVVKGFADNHKAPDKKRPDADIGDLDHPEMQESIRRVKAVAPGTRIVITADTLMSQLGFEPPQFIPAVLLSHSEDPRTAVVKLDDEPATREVNVSRIYGADDPAVLAVFAGYRR